MIIKTIDLFLAVADCFKNDCETVDIEFYPKEDDFDAQISMGGLVDEFETIDLEPIYEADSPEREEPVNTPDSPSPIIFTNKEMSLLKFSLEYSIDHCLSLLKSSTISADDRSRLAKQLKEFEALKNEVF